MVKKTRTDAIFKKPETKKIARLKKIKGFFFEGNKSEYKKFYIFLLASVILIFSFFSLPSIVKHIDDGFVKNKIYINKSFILLFLINSCKGNCLNCMDFDFATLS